MEENTKTVLYALTCEEESFPKKGYVYPPGYHLEEAYEYCEANEISIYRNYSDYDLWEGSIGSGVCYGLNRLLKDARNGLFQKVIFWFMESYLNKDRQFYNVIYELEALNISHESIYESLWCIDYSSCSNDSE